MVALPQSRDLISVGAYVAGGDRDTDLAIALHRNCRSSPRRRAAKPWPTAAPHAWLRWWTWPKRPRKPPCSAWVTSRGRCAWREQAGRPGALSGRIPATVDRAWRQRCVGQWLMGYQGFLNQLETAVGQQRQSLAWHQNNLDKARESWQAAFARVEGLRKLVQRYIDEARAIEDKREQKLLDELSQRMPRKDVY
ncbi:flagellar fliJ protein [Ditylenchus destructor]|nr:flagellar fliJ protein [Ditylenchus destructor]